MNTYGTFELTHPECNLEYIYWSDTQFQDPSLPPSSPSIDCVLGLRYQFPISSQLVYIDILFMYLSISLQSFIYKINFIYLLNFQT